MFERMAPGVLDIPGVGPVTAAIILASCSHRGRGRSEAAFAALASVSPIPASSRNTKPAPAQPLRRSAAQRHRRVDTGSAVVIIASIITSSIAVGTKSATNSPAPTIPPAAPSSALATDIPGATKSERGNIIRALGQGAGLSDKSGNQAVSFVLNKITIDPVGTGKYAQPPQNGHFLALDISAQTYPPLKDLFGSGQFDFSAFNWKLIAANGTTYNGSSGPATGYLADAEKVTGRLFSRYQFKESLTSFSCRHAGAAQP